jgi:drug/metabolite transporter (DMT)-like permease
MMTKTITSKKILSTNPPIFVPSWQRHQVGIGVACAVIGAIAFSGKAIIVKLAYRYGVDAVTVIMLRMLFALPLFVAMAWWAGRGKARLSKRDWLGVMGLGFSGYYLASMLDFVGLQYITASLERLILYLSPTVVLVLEWRFRGRRITKMHLAATAVSYAGVLLVFGLEWQGNSSASGTRTGWGALMIILSVFVYAIYLLYSGDFVRRLGSMRLAGLATSIACLCCIVQFLLLRPPSAALVATPVIWLSVLNAVGCTAVPVLLVMMSIERLGSSMTAQIGMIGPISTILMSIAFLGESFTPLIAIGTLLVVLGIFLFSRAGR